MIQEQKKDVTSREFNLTMILRSMWKYQHEYRGRGKSIPAFYIKVARLMQKKTGNESKVLADQASLKSAIHTIEQAIFSLYVRYKHSHGTEEETALYNELGKWTTESEDLDVCWQMIKDFYGVDESRRILKNHKKRKKKTVPAEVCSPSQKTELDEALKEEKFSISNVCPSDQNNDKGENLLRRQDHKQDLDDEFILTEVQSLSNKLRQAEKALQHEEEAYAREAYEVKVLKSRYRAAKSRLLEREKAQTGHKTRNVHVISTVDPCTVDQPPRNVNDAIRSSFEILQKESKRTEMAIQQELHELRRQYENSLFTTELSFEHEPRSARN
uniref:AlNc14C12G1458 protein n=1 Tax=Albugo laibachii Nc14 TaxID=890382 RepID=F0W380_9STRA|nr:AlNc14C12G1458 [Albugo laibachii Nc14]|eukprot:CCA15521.1 AlNc14C12G1458 [Albugo laibachii Nc14]